MSSSVGSVLLTLEFSSKSVNETLNKTQGKIKTAFAATGKKSRLSFLDAFNTSLVAAGVQKAFNSISNTIANSIDDAIYRADTLNRFPKVMEMMGYSANDAANAIAKLKDGVTGIPTSLADVTNSTQRLAALTSDVNSAADWALALSDAMLITTGDTNEAARATEQFIQMLSRGKPAGNDWNTIMEVASPIMNELARSMGYAGAELGGDFYTALQDGTLSMNELMDAMVKLDTEGGGGLESLHNRVKTSTGGIAATITNLKQSVSNAIVDIIQTIGSENIENAIKDIRDALVGIIKVVGVVIKFVKENWNWVGPILAGVATAITAITIAQSILNLTLLASPITWIIAAIAAVITIILLVINNLEWLKKIVGEVGKFFGMVFNTIGKIIGVIVGKFINDIQTIVGAIIGFWQTVIGLVVGYVQMVWENGPKQIIDFVVNMWIAIIAILAIVGEWIWNNVLSPIIGFVSGFIGTIVGFVDGVRNAIFSIIGGIASWINDNVIQPTIQFWSGLIDTIISGIANFIGTVTSIIGTIVGWISSNVIAPIGSFFSGLWNGITAGVNAMAEGIKNVMASIAGFIKAPINGIIGAINGVIDGINSIKVPDWVPGIGGASANFPHVPYLAQGGYAGNGATGAVIGEAGKEVVLPLEQNTDNWAGLLASTLAEQFEKDETVGGRDIIMNNKFEINNEMDANDIGRVLMESIRRSA